MTARSRARALGVALVLSGSFAASAQDRETVEPELAPAKPAPEPLPERRELARKIRAATARAARRIARAHVAASSRTLAALALLRAGGAEERIAARKLLDSWWDDASHNRLGHTANYELALAISSLEGLSLELVNEVSPTLVTRYEKKNLDPDVARMLEVATRALLDGRVTTFDGKGCAFGYGTAPFQQTTRSRGPKDGAFDNSNTQFALLALHDAARAGIEVPRDVLAKLAEHFMLCASPELPRKVAPGETFRATRPVYWGYVAASFERPSMTFAALSSLAIIRDAGLKDERVDAAIEGGLLGLPTLIGTPDAPLEEKKQGWGTAYQLYSMEKALDLLEVSEERAGRDWFAGPARDLVESQHEDGLWEGGIIDSCLHVLFLTRGTVSSSRVVDGRTASGGAHATAEVYLPKTHETVDAVALVGSFVAEKEPRAAAAARARVGEAISALIAEGHGGETGVLPALVDLLEGKAQRREAATAWLRDMVGHDMLDEEAKLAARWAVTLREARAARRAGPARAAVAQTKLPLPLRAYAASSLAQLPCPQAVPDLLRAAEGLLPEKGEILGGPSGRCARTFADALTGLVRAQLPALAPTGPVKTRELRELLFAASTAHRRSMDAAIDRALEAQANREKDKPSWERARADLAVFEVPGLRRVLAIAENEKRAGSAFALLRAATGETLPDGVRGWTSYVDSLDDR